MSDDLALLEAWRSGDPRAGDALAAHYFRQIFRRIEHRVGSEAAKDLTQQVFLAALEKRDDIVEDFGKYVQGIARFKLMEHFRSRRFEEIESKVDSSDGPISVLAKKEDRMLLVGALETLSDEEQAYVMWYYVDGMTQGDIAERVGLAEFQIKGRIHRVREKLRRQLEELGSSDQRAELQKGFETWARSLRRRVRNREGQ